MSLSGPEIRPQSGKAPKQLVMILHGLGADGQNLIDIAAYMSAYLPDAHFIAPNAPYAFDMAPIGYQWFSRQNATEDTALAGLKKAEPLLNKFIDAQLKRFNLSDSCLALIGFSQGTMTALHVALRRKRKIAVVIGFSGALIYPQKLKTELSARPPVILIHGQNDEVLPVTMTNKAAMYLKEYGVEVKTKIYNNLSHSISQEGLEFATKELLKAFEKAL